MERLQTSALQAAFLTDQRVLAERSGRLVWQLERQALYRGVFTNVTDLKAAIRQFITAHNEHSAKPFKWNKTAEAVINSVHVAKLSMVKNKLMN